MTSVKKKKKKKGKKAFDLSEELGTTWLSLSLKLLLVI